MVFQYLVLWSSSVVFIVGAIMQYNDDELINISQKPDL